LRSSLGTGSQGLQVCDSLNQLLASSNDRPGIPCEFLE
jgi:hypothetical protein